MNWIKSALILFCQRFLLFPDSNLLFIGSNYNNKTSLRNFSRIDYDYVDLTFDEKNELLNLQRI